MNQVAKKYLNDVKSCLPCSASQKKRYMTDIAESITSHVQLNPDCCYENLVDMFGAPEDIAEAYISNLGAKEFCKKLSTSKMVRGGVVAGVVLLIIIVVALISKTVSVWEIANGYFYDVVYELPEEAPSELSVYGVY